MLEIALLYVINVATHLECLHHVINSIYDMKKFWIAAESFNVSIVAMSNKVVP